MKRAETTVLGVFINKDIMVIVRGIRAIRVFVDILRSLGLH